MAGKTITSANSIYMLSIANLFPIAQQLQGYSADAAFSTEAITPFEGVMGVDGFLSGGWVPVERKQTIMIMPDSDSSDMFDAWHAAEEAAREKYIANALIVLSGTNREYTCFRGFLSTYTPIPEVAKVLRARSFGITWQSITAGPV
jgi:hypothetical protein